MLEGITICIVVGVSACILWPIVTGVSSDTGQQVADASLEQRYTRALLDLESDVLGGRITEAEFEERKSRLAEAVEAKTG